MIFATIENNGKEQLCCVDKEGERAFLLEVFFQRDLSEFCIKSNQTDKVPGTMEELINRYNELWTDDIALFFGSNPDLAIALDRKNNWLPLKNLDEIWSPLDERRGLSLLE